MKHAGNIAMVVLIAAIVVYSANNVQMVRDLIGPPRL